MPDYKAEALSMLTNVAGGAVAGALDIQFADKMPLGLPVGAVTGLGLVGLGLLGQSNRSFADAAKYAGELGTGMLSAEAGFATASRMVKMKQAAAAAAQPAVAGRLGRGGAVISAADLRRDIASIRRA